MSKIVITIDYSVDMEDYPEHLKTKSDALRYDLEMFKEGYASSADLLEWADSVTYEVVDDA